MKKIQVVLDIPHGGTNTPSEVIPYSIVNPKSLLKNSDRFAPEIYETQPVKQENIVTNPYWRLYLDTNRRIDDLRSGGIVKTHTFYGEQIYKSEHGLPKEVAQTIITKYAHPKTPGAYYNRLYRAVEDPSVKAIVLGHTMGGIGQVRGVNPGKVRPLFCLSNGGDKEGNPSEESFATKQMLEFIRDEIRKRLGDLNIEGFEFDGDVKFNNPFHAKVSMRRIGLARISGRPTVQIEINKNLFLRMKTDQQRAHNIQIVQEIIRAVIDGIATNLL